MNDSLEDTTEIAANTSQSETKTNRVLAFASPARPESSDLQASELLKSSVNDALSLRVPLKVYLRMRPLTSSEVQRAEVNCMRVLGSSSVAIHAPKDSHTARTKGETEGRFMFTHVFGSESTQEDVYTETSGALTEGLINGQNGLIFTYGVTNAGKTFTIQGNREHPGLIPRTVSHLFSLVKPMSLKDPSISQPVPPNIISDFFGKARETVLKLAQSISQGKAKSKVVVTVSYLEIYNEQVYDLLCDVGNEKKDLNLREHKGKIIIPDLKEVCIESLEDAMEVLRRGQMNRQRAETMVNHDSSRSHSVFTVKLYSLGKLQKVSENRCARFSIVDLAGSERLVRTQNTGARLKEAANINNSLGVLARCMEALRSNQQQSLQTKQAYVPFRQSKLTRIFQDFFMGCGRMAMIINVSPSGSDFDETLHVLKFSAIAKEVSLTTRIDTGSKVNKKPTEQPDSSNQGQPVQMIVDPDLVEENARLQQKYDELAQLVEIYRIEKIDLEERLRDLEGDIRFEASVELSEKLREMEASWRSRIECEIKFMDESHEKRLEFLQKASASVTFTAMPKKITALRQAYRKLYERTRIQEEIIHSLKRDLGSKISIIKFKQIEIDQLKKTAKKSGSSEDNGGIHTNQAQNDFSLSTQMEQQDKLDIIFAEIERTKIEHENEQTKNKAQIEQLSSQLKEFMIEIARLKDLSDSRARENEALKTKMTAVLRDKLMLESQLPQTTADQHMEKVNQNPSLPLDSKEQDNQEENQAMCDSIEHNTAAPEKKKKKKQKMKTKEVEIPKADDMGNDNQVNTKGRSDFNAEAIEGIFDIPADKKKKKKKNKANVVEEHKVEQERSNIAMTENVVTEDAPFGIVTNTEEEKQHATPDKHILHNPPHRMGSIDGLSPIHNQTFGSQSIECNSPRDSVAAAFGLELEKTSKAPYPRCVADDEPQTLTCINVEYKENVSPVKKSKLKSLEQRQNDEAKSTLMSGKKLKRKVSASDSLDLVIDDLESPPPSKRLSSSPKQNESPKSHKNLSHKPVIKEKKKEKGLKKPKSPRPVIYEDKSVNNSQSPITESNTKLGNLQNGLLGKGKSLLISPRNENFVNQQSIKNEEIELIPTKSTKKKLFNKKPKAVQEQFGEIEIDNDFDPFMARRLKQRAFS